LRLLVTDRGLGAAAAAASLSFLSPASLTPVAAPNVF
jgi:hypothetical protein